MLDWRNATKESTKEFHWSHLKIGLRKHGPFTSCNDEMVREHWRQKDAARQADDTKRKRRERRRGLRGGVVDELYVRAAIAECDDRLQRFARHYRATQMPRMISKLTPQSLEFITSVWLAMWLLKPTGKCRPVDIADWLTHYGRCQMQARASLQGRVKKDLERVRLIESMTVPGTGELIWPPFDPEDRIANGTLASRAEPFAW